MTAQPGRDPRQFPLLACLSAEALEMAGAALRWSQYHQGQIILGQDDTSGDVFFLAEGRLLAVTWTEDGREIIFSAMAEGSYFGELTALDGGSRSLCVYARTPCHLAVIPGPVFCRLMDEDAGFRAKVLRDLTARIRALTERNFQLMTFSVPERVKAFILRRAAEQGCLTPGSVLAEFPTHAEIAARIGANREAVSRSLSALAQAGIIASRRGSLTLLSPEDLLSA